ncbi:PemK-like, MazF-like toxin of type II toxin-antitoxin system [uncultured archaeon]|nr:PemK-like, MazF-like toxin of type II toxin-antitoxin system [uncultured archaeon]
MKFSFGQIILAQIQYTDTFEVKTRPALVLFEEQGNIVVAGITSNTKMKGIFIPKKEGLPRDSVIKLNYIFTISKSMVKKFISNLSGEKKKLIKNELINKIT